jgi:hypothetical protein
MIQSELKQAIGKLTSDELAELMQWLQTVSVQKQNDTPVKPRTPGLSPGVLMSDDFNDELPDSFWFDEA